MNRLWFQDQLGEPEPEPETNGKKGRGKQKKKKKKKTGESDDTSAGASVDDGADSSTDLDLSAVNSSLQQRAPRTFCAPRAAPRVSHSHS